MEITITKSHCFLLLLCLSSHKMYHLALKFDLFDSNFICVLYVCVTCACCQTAWCHWVKSSAKSHERRHLQFSRCPINYHRLHFSNLTQHPLLVSGKWPQPNQTSLSLWYSAPVFLSFGIDLGYLCFCFDTKPFWSTSSHHILFWNLA